MKLSQLRTLSWTVAITGIAIAATVTMQTIQSGLALKGKSTPKWKPSEPDLDAIKYKERLSDHEIGVALARIMKREPPPQAPEPVVHQPITPEVKSEPVLKPLNLQVTLIAYDSSGKKKSAAFIKSTSNRLMASVFNVGEMIFDTNAKLIAIEKTLIRVKRSDGSVVVLRPNKAKISDTSKRFPVRPSTKSGKPVAVAQVQKPKVKWTGNIDPIQVRTKPKSRKVIRDETYGIDIVEYDSEDDKFKRYALSFKDKVTLENEKFRLMTEVIPTVATDKDGKAVGIKVGFNVDKPLLKKFGILENDVLTHVNDTPVNNNEQAMQIYNKLDPNSKRVKLTIKRNNNPMVIFFEMDDFKNVKPPPGG